MPAKKTAWSLQFDSADEARKAAKESAIAFYVLAGIQALVSLVLGWSILIDAVLFAALGVWLHLAHSRIAATLLLILAGAGAVTTLMNKFGMYQGGGSNVFLALIASWAAVRAVVATYKLPGLLKQQPAPIGST